VLYAKFLLDLQKENWLLLLKWVITVWAQRVGYCRSWRARRALGGVSAPETCSIPSDTSHGAPQPWGTASLLQCAAGTAC
jgi:hypothetical protein